MWLQQDLHQPLLYGKELTRQIYGRLCTSWTSDTWFYRSFRHIPVGLLTVSLHPSTPILTDLTPPTSLSSFTTVSSPTTRNSRLSWRRMAMCSRLKLTLSVSPSSPSISMTEKRPTVTWPLPLLSRLLSRSWYVFIWRSYPLFGPLLSTDPVVSFILHRKVHMLSSSRASTSLTKSLPPVVVPLSWSVSRPPRSSRLTLSMSSSVTLPKAVKAVRTFSHLVHPLYYLKTPP